VAESNSFTAAARSLSIAQPSLSHTIAALERELGVTLFERLPRGVRITEAGGAMLEPARRVLRSFALVHGAARSANDAGYGKISIISNTLWAIEPLVGVVGEFRRLHPAVQFVVAHPERRSDVIEMVRSGAADFGLLDGEPPPGTLANRRLVHHELVAVLPPRALLDLASVTVGQLVPLGLICTPKGSDLRAILDARLEADGQRPEVAVETAHLASLIPLILAGAGAALLPEGLAGEAEAKGARVLRMEPRTVSEVHLVWRHGSLTPMTEHFLSVATDLCRRDLGSARP
jgi:LysR family transcriptional regulator, carnitine catabolism transcriptional activator